ncbi:MAG: thioredoxin-disulfide reductase [Candidatus Pacebacteria bacterium]|nr:thioredoxin-disulfide reductase [Candidatus Paceibacterota bacterium]
MVQHHRVIIIGSGPAGYSAAIYAARANLAPVMIAGMEPGGQLMVTTDVENYPGFVDAITGPELMEAMRGQAERFGTLMIDDMVTRVDFSRLESNGGKLLLWADSGDEYSADAVIIATGAQARWLGIESEVRLRGFGVSACATCDGFFFKNKRVAVIGGGNSAVEEAIFLTQFARKVTVVHRRDSFRAEKILQDRLFANPKVEVIWNHRVLEILGTDDPKSVTGLRLAEVASGAEQQIELDGVFVAIGHTPATAVFKDHLPMDADGYLITRADSTATEIAGVFAAGDVKDRVYRQAVTAAGMGCMAALEVGHYLNG